jgi:hypothetical protein
MTERQPTDSFPAGRSEHPSTSPGTAATPTAPLLLPPADEVMPRPFGRYELRRLLGKGGMGRVYLAHDPHLDRLVALKMPNPLEGVAAWRERFLTEARAAATLTHPNVCPVYDVGEVEGQPYLTMGFIEGETLAARLTREGTLAPVAAAELVRTVSRAMQEAHRRGIVHRDLKPANLMLDTAGRPVVMDFGLAVRSTPADDLRLTLTGVALGTPAYMPPEQASGEHESIGPPSDVYSLGVILYELVTGRVPFKGKSFGKLLAQIERDPPPAPRSLNPEVGEALQSIILTALAKSPADRFADAGVLADALDRYLTGDRDGLISLYSKPYQIPEPTGEYQPASQVASGPPPRRPNRRAWWLAAAAVLLLATAAGAVIYVETDYGRLVVQLSDPNAKVDVRVNGQEVTLTPDGSKPVRVRAGKDNMVEVRGEGFETVAKSYTLTRGEIRVATITLEPKEVAGGKGGGTAVTPIPGEGSGSTVPPKPEPPRPVEYPKKPTLIELPGGQILADANKDEMQKWLDERKAAKHSVTWLDSYPVTGKPLFTAVAVLDDRESNWIAMLEVPFEEMQRNFPSRKVDFDANYVRSISGFSRDGELFSTLLWLPGTKRWGYGAAEPFETIEKKLNAGAVFRNLRPFPNAAGAIRWAGYAEPNSPHPTVLAHKLAEADLAGEIAKVRAGGRIPISLAAAVEKDRPEFALLSGKNTGQFGWQAEWGLTAAQLAESAKARQAGQFRPDTVTAYGWDGAVRYCVVWVKEPPRPVKYPEKATLIEMPGWEILADASRDEMQAWLDERKKAKHSVTWLDCYAVGDRPVFCAVAALDDRSTGWNVLLETPATDFNPNVLGKQFHPTRYRAASISGYGKELRPHAAVLWLPVTGKGGRWGIWPDDKEEEAERELAGSLTNGYVPRCLRPYTVAPGVLRYAQYDEESLGEKSLHAFALSPPALEGLLAKARTAGFRPGMIAGYIKDGLPTFAAVARPNPEKWEWQTDTTLTTPVLKAKAMALSAKGFHPVSVTAYPWDGAVRYCVVWVKEPPKQEEPPKKP